MNSHTDSVQPQDLARSDYYLSDRMKSAAPKAVLWMLLSVFAFYQVGVYMEFDRWSIGGWVLLLIMTILLVTAERWNLYLSHPPSISRRLSSAVLYLMVGGVLASWLPDQLGNTTKSGEFVVLSGIVGVICIGMSLCGHAAWDVRDRKQDWLSEGRM